MSDVFQLEKEVEKVRFVLTKQGIDHVVRAQVGLDLDVSGSMRELYEQGVVQRVVERVLPLGLACDENGQIDVWGFSNGAQFACAADRQNYQNIVEQEMLDGDLDHVLWGGTEYAPAIQANLRHYGLLGHGKPTLLSRLFGDSRPRSTLPVIVYFVTDGANSDERAAWDQLEAIEGAEAQIYYLLLGVGSDQYRFLKRAADTFPNVGFLAVPDLASFVSEDGVYEQLLPRELCAWLKHEHEGEDDDHHD